MLGWALMFLSVALAAGVLGFGGLATASAGVAQAIFFVAVGAFTLTIVANAMRA